jgi:uncharacterized protein YyaL (SSP411 family)
MTQGPHKHTNKLIHETSPYLLQHAHNPVEWYSWGPEALERAKTEQKPILLSIGYSACHWCHVMERESFENEEIAALMNAHFINIKVDREERPDLDQIYQTAVQMFLGRGGGWPLTMFLTPEGKPFYGGTYFPPVDRHNLPAFSRVLLSVAEAYKQKPEQVEKTTSQILKGLSQISVYAPSQELMSVEAIQSGAQALAKFYEPVHGGFGGAPKFPNTMALSIFLRYQRITGDQSYLNRVKHTLRKMAEGGIYDHLGGGFHRYSVDEVWLVPHFEKMLYDNSQLIKLYLETYQASGDEFFKRIAVESLAYVQREMWSPEGGFYSTQDADSEGEEGKFFVWTPAEVIEILGEKVGRIFCRYYDVTNHGNFDEKNILHTDLPLEVIAQEFHKSPDELSTILEEARQKMFLARERRVKPFRDEKVLVSWNSLMLSAVAEAYKILGDPAYLEMGRKCASFISADLLKNDRLLSTYKDGLAKLNGYLDDYAFFIAALLDLYEATFEAVYLEQADHQAHVLLEQFWDEAGGGFYFTGKDHESLITRTKSGYDHSIPSGNAVAAMDLLRLYYLTDHNDYLTKAEQALRLFYQPLQENPFGYSGTLAALDFYLEKPREVVLVGKKESPETQHMLNRIHSLYLPNKILTFLDPNRPVTGHLASMITGKSQQNGKLTVYVCHNFTCSLPVTDWEALKEMLLAK